MITQDKVIVVDIDGTLAARPQVGQSYAQVSPIPSVVERLCMLSKQGYWIILYTSRNMRTYDGNLGQIMRHTAPVLIDWLAHHQIPYDEIHFGKPWCGREGFYVDDRAIRPREFATLSHQEIEAVLQKDRCQHE